MEAAIQSVAMRSLEQVSAERSWKHALRGLLADGLPHRDTVNSMTVGIDIGDQHSQFCVLDGGPGRWALERIWTECKRCRGNQALTDRGRRVDHLLGGGVRISSASPTMKATTHRVLIAVAGMLLAAPVFADTLRVPKDFATIQAAVDQTQPGDVIVVSKGTYEENVVIDGKTNISLRGKGKPVVDAAGAGPALQISNSTGIEVRGFRCTDGQGNAGAGVHIDSSNDVMISRCIIDDNDDDGVGVESCADVTIERCKIMSNDDDGICLFETTGGIVSKNRIEDSDEKGIEVGSNVGLSLGATISRNRVDDSGDDGIRISSSDVLVEKNSVSDSGQSGVVINSDSAFPPSGIEILRNNVRNSGDHGIKLVGSGQVADKNRIKDSDDHGVSVDGEGGHTVTRNRVSGADEGIAIKPGADNNTIMKNVVTGAIDDGVDVESSGNQLESNTVKMAGNNGFEVNASGNTFTKNKAAKSGQFDLQDDAGGNTYSMNKFKTVDGDVEQ